MNSQSTTAPSVAIAPEPKRPKFSIRKVWAALGPGLITGASDDDPSGIGTYAVAGATFGYSTLWAALVTLPLMAAVQFVCAKIGMVSGRGLAGILREYYPRWLLMPVIGGLVVANTINAGVDIGAIAEGLNMFVPVPVTLLVFPIAILLLVLQVYGSYRLIARIFMWLTLALFAYIGAAFFAHPNWSQVLSGTLVPRLHLDRTYLATLVAIFGTTISPYLFFWQANQEVEEEKAKGRIRLWQRRGATQVELHYAAWDVNLGMLMSNIVMYFIILATAATLHEAGRTDVQTAADAAEALRPLAGDAAALLLSLGLIGSGCLAVPVLTTSSAYAVCEACRWRHGLNEKLARAHRFYAVMIAGTLIGTLINFIGVTPISMLFWTAVLNGLLAPPLLVVIMLIARNQRIMGKHVNGKWTNFLGWTAAIIMFVAAGGLLLTWNG